MEGLIKTLAANGCGVGGPDTMHNAPTLGERYYTGASGGADYRGVVPIAHAVQSADTSDGHTPTEIFDNCYNSKQCNYMFWLRKSGDLWTNSIVPALRARPSLRTICPSRYADCDAGQ